LAATYLEKPPGGSFMVTFVLFGLATLIIYKAFDNTRSAKPPGNRRGITVDELQPGAFRQLPSPGAVHVLRTQTTGVNIRRISPW